MDSHLQSAMREHLDLACTKLNSTQVQLNEQRVLLDETRVILAETKAKLSLLSSPDGSKKSFIWKIKFSESFSQAKGGVKEKIESDPFYTGSYGYKLKVFASYIKEIPRRRRLRRILRPGGEFFSIGVILMEGEYDDILPWPFSNKITFTLIDHNKDLEKRQNCIDYLSPRKNKAENIFSKRPGKNMMTVESEIRRFMVLNALHGSRFTVNGALFIQVDIEPDN